MLKYLGVLWIIMLAGLAQAHEVRPAIGDFEVSDGQFVLDLRFGAEPVVAGANLEGVEDTNATDRSDEIDRLRALAPEDLEAALRGKVPEFLSKVTAVVDGTPLTLDVASIVVGPIGEVDLPRETEMQIAGSMPQGAQVLEVTWPAEYGTLILRQQGVEEPYTGYLGNGEDSGAITIGGGNEMSGWGFFATYIPVGFDHIVPLGLDHILFVLGLFFLSSRLGPLLWQVSAFTLAHTVTLALGALGIVNIPGSIVEPIIAASIVYVAVENILSDKLHRWRTTVIFIFGLLHGLGFASVLGEFGLPSGAFFPALIGFNVGVELGQLSVIALAFAMVWLAQRVGQGNASVQLGKTVYVVLALGYVVIGYLLSGPGFTERMGAGSFVFFGPLVVLSVLCLTSVLMLRLPDAYRRCVAIPSSAGIALIGAYWFVERVFL